MFNEKQCVWEMSKVYNQIGSLKAIKSHLIDHKINDFNSLNDIIFFQKNYCSSQEQIIANHTNFIEQEKITLKEEIEELELLIENIKSEAIQKLNLELKELKQRLDRLIHTKSILFEAIVKYLKRSVLKKKIQNIENNFEYIIANSVIDYTDTLLAKTNRYNFIVFHFSNAVNQSANSELKELERKKTIIEQISPFIYGAIGENKVSKELEKLSDDYILINDFNCSFQPPIYNNKENDYIKSVQIDHILIATSGIFLIETKNWSEHSINNLSLRSPIDQVRRANLALFNLLNREIANSLSRHHWGNIKIPIRNLIVLIHQKPTEEFQYVKILTLREVNNYIEYFNPIFSTREAEMIADFLLKINRQNTN